MGVDTLGLSCAFARHDSFGDCGRYGSVVDRVVFDSHRIGHARASKARKLVDRRRHRSDFGNASVDAVTKQAGRSFRLFFDGKRAVDDVSARFGSVNDLCLHSFKNLNSVFEKLMNKMGWLISELNRMKLLVCNGC